MGTSMKKTLSVNVALILVTGVACLVWLLMRLFMPMQVLPALNVPTVALFIVAAMAVAYCVSGELDAIHGVGILIAGATVAVLPLCVGLAAGSELLPLFGAGVAVSALCWLVLGTLAKRLAGRPLRRLTFAVSALLLALAFQGLSGMVL